MEKVKLQADLKKLQSYRSSLESFKANLENKVAELNDELETTGKNMHRVTSKSATKAILQQDALDPVSVG